MPQMTHQLVVHHRPTIPLYVLQCGHDVDSYADKLPSGMSMEGSVETSCGFRQEMAHTIAEYISFNIR